MPSPLQPRVLAGRPERCSNDPRTLSPLAPGRPLLTDSSQDQPSFRRLIAHPKLRELYDLWLEGRGGGIAMPRAALDPVDIPHLLPHLILSDVADGGRSIFYRLVGTDIVNAHGFDYTGKTIQQLTSGSTREFTYELYATVVNDAVPVYSEGRFRWAGREYRRTKRLHLPLTRGGTEVDMVLSGQVFEQGVEDRHELLVAARPEELAADRSAAR
jgi:hypothetical protein